MKYILWFPSLAAHTVIASGKRPFRLGDGEHGTSFCASPPLNLCKRCACIHSRETLKHLPTTMQGCSTSIDTRNHLHPQFVAAPHFSGKLGTLDEYQRQIFHPKNSASHSTSGSGGNYQDLPTVVARTCWYTRTSYSARTPSYHIRRIIRRPCDG